MNVKAVPPVLLALCLCSCVKPLPPFFSAIYKGDEAAVRRLIDTGRPLNLAEDGHPPLFRAVMYKRYDIVKLLLSKGADVNSVCEPIDGWRPLHAAAFQGDVRLIKMLADSGADFSLLNHKGETALDIARNAKANSAVLQLLESRSPSTSVVAVDSHQSVDSIQTIVPVYSESVKTDEYAVVVGIEKYSDLPIATYAERDAAAVRDFIRAMGVPERNIVFLTGNRATKTGMEKTIEAWLPNNVSEKSRVFVFYSGHGAPDPKTGDAYLVPSDGDPQYLAQTGYPLKRLYSKLGQLKAKSVLVALDSCFSGAGGRSVLAKGTRPLVGKVDLAIQAEGKVSVISASAGDQISGANDEVGYGLFTYNFLQGLNGAAKDAQGRVTLKSLYGYLKPRVQDEARRNNREQTPQLQRGSEEDFILRSK